LMTPQTPLWTSSTVIALSIVSLISNVGILRPNKPLLDQGEESSRDVVAIPSRKISLSQSPSKD
jgi:hypothetical protein